jgi:hypothetical protein
MKIYVNKIISGGQTGADLAGADFALASGIKQGGFCPKDRNNEDGFISEKYNFIRCGIPGYPARTKENVRLADATIIFTGHKLGAGSRLTERSCKSMSKPCLVVMWNGGDVVGNALSVATFLRGVLPKVLNIAGSRESTTPGIHDHVMKVLELVLFHGVEHHSYHG